MNAQALAAQVLAKSAQSSAQQSIVAFTARASFEATRPARGDIEALRAGIALKTPIGGDLAAPAGPFFAAMEVIESGLLQSRGIVEVGIAAYPDGHPRLGPTELDRALAAKVEAAAETGLAVHIVTQFGFSAPAILNWIARLRDQGIDLPVRVGLAGPATRKESRFPSGPVLPWAAGWVVSCAVTVSGWFQRTVPEATALPSASST